LKEDALKEMLEPEAIREEMRIWREKGRFGMS
jgi:hypothetical protein